MATNAYIKMDGITGGSSAASHTGEIEVISWSHGFSQPTSPVRSTAGGGTVEQSNHSNFTFTKYLDSATDDLLKACWAGKQVKTAVVTCYRSDGTTANTPVEYLKIEMTHVIVSNYSVSGGAGDMPVENVSLDYGIVKYTYKPQKRADGTGGDQVSVQHDLETRKVS
ncbi:MAG: type VI secretion system tube protein Hcp [Acidobacteriota bacterium]|nr:type VI secretion system tube protein Hcp [Acidobacteriota bacterium]